MEKAEFVLKCGELLKITKPHLVSCELKKGEEIPINKSKKNYEHYVVPDDDYVVITCQNRARYVLPIQGNTKGW